MIVYKVTNKINDKEYVGQTVGSLTERKRKHINDVLNKRGNMYFHRAIRKYGLENFIWETIHECVGIDDLNKWEIYYIKYYNTFNNGYNLTKGGGGMVGWKASIETRRKIAAANKSRIILPETRRKLSQAFAGKNHPLYGKCGKNSPNYGRKCSKETIQKMSKSQKGRTLSEETKRRLSKAKKGKFLGKKHPMAKAITINNNYFDTRKEAAEFLKVTPALIRYRIMHKTKWLDYSYAQI